MLHYVSELFTNFYSSLTATSGQTANVYERFFMIVGEKTKTIS